MAAADVKRGRWFLPEAPDVLGLLRNQLAVTIEGLDALAAWAGGDAVAAEAVRAAEARGDTSKRELLNAIRDSFVTPIAAEDLFALSRGIDWILNYARDLIEEAEAMDCAPDAGIAEMAGLLGQAARKIDDAIGQLDSDPDRATAAADAAIKAERKLEHVYYQGMAGPTRGDRHARAHLPPRALPQLLAHRRAGDRRRRANRLRGGQGELTRAASTGSPRDRGH